MKKTSFIFIVFLLAKISYSFFLAPPGLVVFEKKELTQVQKEVIAWRERTKDVVPCPSIEVMIEAVKKGGRGVWERVTKKDEHVLYLLNLSLKRMKEIRPGLQHIEIWNINTDYMSTRLKIPEIGKSLKGLSEYYLRQTEEETFRAALLFMRESLSIDKFIKPYSIKPYSSINEMLKAGRKMRRPDWKRARKKKEHVHYLLDLLLLEINRNKSLLQYKGRGDINVPQMLEIKIPEIDKSIYGLLNSYRGEKKKSFSEALKLMKQENDIEDTLTASMKFPLEDGKDDWESVCKILNTSRKGSDITPVNILSFLKNAKLTDAEQIMLKKEMHEEENRAALEALVQARIKWVRWIVWKVVKRDPSLNIDDVDAIMQHERKALYWLYWRWDPSRNIFPYYACLFSKKGIPIGGRIVGIIKDYRRQKLGTRRKKKQTIPTIDPQLLAKTVKEESPDTAIVSDEEVKALLREIYYPEYNKLKERNISIYIMHRNGMSFREIRLELKKKEIILSISGISLIIKPINQALKVHLDKIKSKPIDTLQPQDNRRINICN